MKKKIINKKCFHNLHDYDTTYLTAQTYLILLKFHLLILRACYVALKKTMTRKDLPKSSLLMNSTVALINGNIING